MMAFRYSVCEELYQFINFYDAYDPSWVTSLMQGVAFGFHLVAIVSLLT